MISPIMANSIVAQTQNVNVINHGDESRTQVNYQNSQVIVEGQREEAHNTIISSQDSNTTDTKHDAREEGKNKYFNNRDDSKKKKPSPEGVVLKKQSGGFDMSV